MSDRNDELHVEETAARRVAKTHRSEPIRVLCPTVSRRIIYLYTDRPMESISVASRLLEMDWFAIWKRVPESECSDYDNIASQ